MAIGTTWTDPSDAGTLDLDTDDTLTEAVWDAVMSNIKRLGGTAGLLQTTDAGLLLLNESANSKMTIGLTLNQGANDNEIFAAKSSDVTHGMTDDAEADTYATIKKINAANGGVLITGYGASNYAASLEGKTTTCDTTRSTAGAAAIIISAKKISAATVGDSDADSNILAVRNNLTTRFILDTDGDSHQDVGTAWTNFDAHDDLGLLTDLSIAVSRDGDPLRADFQRWLEVNRAHLQRLKLVTFNDDGHHFVNMSRLTMLLVGAVRQLGERINAMVPALVDPNGRPLLSAGGD